MRRWSAFGSGLSWRLACRPLGAAVGALLILLTGCTAGAPGDVAPPAPSTAAPARQTATPIVEEDPDRHFVDQQLPLHDQAVEMSKMVLAKEAGVDPDIRAIAKQVVETSNQEITTMNSWLTAWGPADEDPTGEHAPDDEDDPNHHNADGLMTDGQMELLQYTDGPIKQEVYLEGMVKNRRATVELAETPLKEGRRPEVRAFAQELRTRQLAELGKLEELQRR